MPGVPEGAAQMSVAAGKKCGTCAHWKDLEYCCWEPPKLPFWASISNGDHADYTAANDGKHCPTWERKPEAPAKLCPWSGAKCCGCCQPADLFPTKVNGRIPVCCQAWRDWTLRTYVALIPQEGKQKP